MTEAIRVDEKLYDEKAIRALEERVKRIEKKAGEAEQAAWVAKQQLSHMNINEALLNRFKEVICEIVEEHCDDRYEWKKDRY